MNTRLPNHRRRGLTLTELLIAGTILTMLAAGMG
jgi:prepilin-type N-terminal cleavage/methylation domain-containing protein